MLLGVLHPAQMLPTPRRRTVLLLPVPEPEPESVPLVPLEPPPRL